MRPAGIAAVEAAKADGRWERAYAGPATIQVPEDFATALAAEPTAAANFEKMNKTQRYSVLWRVQTASPQSRPKRVENLVRMVAEGKNPGAAKKSTDRAINDTKTTSRAAVKPPSIRKRPGNKAPLSDGKDSRPRRTGLRPRS